MEKIGFGGSCLWCTEAIFQSLKGVDKVEQGWISSSHLIKDFSEGVIIQFDHVQIDVQTLISIHLYTHSCTANHSMRSKYRSAIYSFSKKQTELSKAAISSLQSDFNVPIVTKVHPFGSFKTNHKTYLDYYFKQPNNPFCETYINPKLKLLMKRFSNRVDREKLNHLEV